MSHLSFTYQYKWERAAGNPILPPDPAFATECTRCMNPWVIRRGDEYWLYYSGGDAEGQQRICLAIAAVSDLTHWERQGVVLDIGQAGGFDARWVVLPHVIAMPDGRWFLYYTGNQGYGKGLSSFPGIGLAASDDGRTFTRVSNQPVLGVTNHAGDPDAIGIAGGSVIRVEKENGGNEWRYYYTGCPTLGDTVFLDQQKRCCLAVSADGIHWERRGVVMQRFDERDYENIATAGPVVQQAPDGRFQMWYSAIGTRWGYYSICYAESDDGLTWFRGNHTDENLQLTPTGDGWEAQMVEYPSIIREDSGNLLLFYCGNGYGSTGIGLARGVLNEK